ncbi:MAG TPA: DNA polymerase III subunit alpha [Actinomycetota bacterium]|nr:DNA polymerase III subunit alpha [Actinomycetota bacterium]
MTGDGFVHLHTHTEYSLLDGAARIEPPAANQGAPTIFTEAERLGMPAVAMTDHGAMFGALRFYEAARAAGITPILGVEAYVAPGSRFDRTPGESEEKYYHLTLLAEDEIGYRNLLRLVSLAHLEGFYHRPRMDKQLLAEHAAGVLCLSGCLSSEIGVALQQGRADRARRVAGEYREIFGPDRYFVELQDHGLADQRRILPEQVAIARDVGVPVVATNDLHYTLQADAKPHDVLLCIQQQKLQSDPKRLKFDSDGFYLKSAEAMRHVFRDLPEACDQTLAIAERIRPIPELERVLVEHKTEYHLPRVETPNGEPLPVYLRTLVERGSVERYDDPVPDEARDRIEHELHVIEQMGFASYFLIVWDLIRFAREQGIRVGPGRGSAAGSVVSYCLRITDLDPLRYGVLFERFLNPERIQMPDIDMDFDERRRDEVIRYATEKYGSDHVAQIVTFQTIKGKQGIRDAARVLGFPPVVGDRLCKMYPPAVMGRDEPIDKALEISPELRDAYEKEPEAREIVDTARALEGLRREDSVHAAGVVIGDAPLVNYLPLKLTKDSKDDAKKIVTQFDMHGVEQLGLLKMDFLGLRNLSVIEDTLRHLRDRGLDLDIDHVPLDDAETYAMLKRGDTTGVFQMESAGMRNLIRLLQPDRFEDLMALVALYRPGPLNNGLHTEYAERKHGRKKVVYPHPDLQPVLQDTYGVMVYQEQVMQTAVTMAGFSMGEADTLRKAMGKKKLEVLMPFKERFIDGATAKGYDRRLADGLFETIVPFADYGFNASHACAYGYVAYQTAYLMAHHTVEYMAAILTSVKDDKDRKPYYLYACRGMGIEVLPPDVNESMADFAPAPGDREAIRYGLSAVRNVGDGVVQAILAARARGGAFTSFADFCRRVEPGVLTKRVFESLILAGAFDSLGYTRGGLVQKRGDGDQAAWEKVAAPILAERKAEAAGQFSLFGGGDDGLTEIDESILGGPELDKRLLLSREKEMLGQFVTDHPLLAVQASLRTQCSHDIARLDELGDGDLVTIGGIIGTLARKYTKRGEPYAQFRLEGLAGGVEVVAFPSVYDAVPELIETDTIVLVTGRIDLRGRELQIRASDVKAPVLELGEAAAATSGGSLVVELPAAACTASVLAKLKHLFEAAPGEVPVQVRFVSSQGVQPLELGRFGVDPRGSLIDEIRSLLGPTSARLEHADGADRRPAAAVAVSSG